MFSIFKAFCNILVKIDDEILINILVSCKIQHRGIGHLECEYFKFTLAKNSFSFRFWPFRERRKC